MTRAALFALLALSTLGATSAFYAPPAVAGTNPGPFSFFRPSDYPYCMRTRQDDDDCSYANYQQCAATASGLGGSCFVNPALAYLPADEQPVAPRRHHRRHHAR